MSKKGSKKGMLQMLEEYDSSFPDWYWKRGLHDAVILSSAELELAPEWKSKHPRRNCLEICLDSSNAMYEQNIHKICLYNYEIKTPEIRINELENPWWIRDKIEQLPNKRYLLEIVIETARGNKKTFVVDFEIPEIERP